jgi:hypothetical protein
LDEDTPGDSPLLKRDNATADLLGRNLSLVDWDDSRADTDGPSSDNTANTEESNAVGGRLEQGTNYPNEGGDLNGGTAG